MRGHIFVHHATTKYFSNSFVFKTKIEKEGLPGDITPALGAGGPPVRIRAPRPLIANSGLYSMKFQRPALEEKVCFT